MDGLIKRFYKEWYRPDLMAVIVVGDIDVNEMEQKIISFKRMHKNRPKRAIFLYLNPKLMRQVLS